MKKEQKKLIISYYMNSTANQEEDRLKELIVKWTKHFHCRKDFIEWQEKRVWQEKYQQKTISELRWILGDLRNKKILDIGCGMGGLLVALQISGADIEGIEQNYDYCEITRLRGRRYNIIPKIHQAFGEDMPFCDNYFDVLICRDVLEHCKNPRQLLREGFRVLKANGKMYVTATNRFGFIDPHYQIKFVNWLPRRIGNFIVKKIIKKDNIIFKDNQDLFNMHYFTIKEFERLIKETGFRIFDNLSERKKDSKKIIKRKILLNYFDSNWGYLLEK